jgi:hypothetical protein
MSPPGPTATPAEATHRVVLRRGELWRTNILGEWRRIGYVDRESRTKPHPWQGIDADTGYRLVRDQQTRDDAVRGLLAKLCIDPREYDTAGARAT